jgi:hypothetical protein
MTAPTLRDPQVYVVARYSTYRAYGGAEEGGWWYTERELERVVLATRDETSAWYAATRLNGVARRLRRYVDYVVVELPRWELRPDLLEAACHLDFDPGPEDYVLRADVPSHSPEHRPHYC